ncbi:Odorant-binding protein 16 isoform X1 [Halyomorpha halys]|nr:Odorant-binding protein 16 isoform X1 [Halyomorpha halys]
MKHILGVGLMTVFLLLAGKPQEETIAKILKSFGSCQAKHPLSADELTALKNQDTEMHFSHDAKCFFACMFKAADLLKNGRIIPENLIEYFNEDSIGVSNSREIIEYCNQEVSESEPDLCEYVYKMTKCWTKKILTS